MTLHPGVSARLLAGIFLAALFLPPPAVAARIDAELSRALAFQPPGEKVRVLARLSTPADLSRLLPESSRAARRAALVRALREAHEKAARPVKELLAAEGARDARSLVAANALAFAADARLIERLAQAPGVERLSLDARLPAPGARSAAAAPMPEWNLDATGATRLWAIGRTGQGVFVAALDSGADAAHPDLSPSWRGLAGGWFDPNGQHAQPAELAQGHGTAMLGVIAGGDAGGSAIGMAPGATWGMAKIYDDAGFASLSAIHAAFDWALDPDGVPETDDQPGVVNNSWGLLGEENLCDEEFAPDIQALRLADVFVVFAAGNTGPSLGTDLPPANNAGAFSVGATEQNGQVALFSGRGPSACGGGLFPLLAAPGADIRTADLTLGGGNPNPYRWVEGTSIAAAHVSGAVALLRAAWPQATVDEVEAALKDSAIDIANAGPDYHSGYGFLDVYGAFRLLAPAGCADGDDDGYYAGIADCGPADCNDAAADIHPGACDLPGDGIDQDCDGIDATTVPACAPPPPCVDEDGDGFLAGGELCLPADCDDANAAINPDACDLPGDGIDQDCSGADAVTRPPCAPPLPSGGGSGGGCFLEKLLQQAP